MGTSGIRKPTEDTAQPLMVCRRKASLVFSKGRRGQQCRKAVLSHCTTAQSISISNKLGSGQIACHRSPTVSQSGFGSKF